MRIVQHRFETHAAQWNFGLDEVRTPWVLALDADYEISPELAAEIQSLNPADSLAGYSVRFQYQVCGRALRSSVYPPRTVLFRRDRCRYGDDGHTQLLKANGRVDMLANFVFHDDRKPLSRWVRSQNNYMVIEARHLLATPSGELSLQDRLRRRIFFAPILMFFYLLLARGLILDGWRGWFYVCQRTIAELILSLRILIEREQLENSSRTGTS